MYIECGVWTKNKNMSFGTKTWMLTVYGELKNIFEVVTKIRQKKKYINYRQSERTKFKNGTFILKLVLTHFPEGFDYDFINFRQSLNSHNFEQFPNKLCPLVPQLLSSANYSPFNKKLTRMTNKHFQSSDYSLSNRLIWVRWEGRRWNLRESVAKLILE